MDGDGGMGDFPSVQVTETEKALRAHLRSHNGSVLAASVMALVFSTIGWAVLYGASYWLTMFALAIANQGETGVPSAFHAVFFGTAAVLMLAARVDQFLFPSERAVDERPPVEHLGDFLFFVPRFTMSCWQNLGALAWLSRGEWPDAARLMDALRLGGRVSLQELPAMFPDDRRLRRTLEALSVTGLIDQRREKSLTWIHLGALAPDVFRGLAGTLPAPEDPLAGVPHARIRRRVKLLSPPEGDGEI
jgi:hypothetical protein